MRSVLVTDSCHTFLVEGLEALGYAVTYLPKISLEETRAQIASYDGLIINSKIIVDKAFVDVAKKLQFIGRLGSGMEIINQDYCAKKGIAVYSSPDGNCNAVGEHALGMLLTLANKYLKGDPEVRKKIWRREENRGFELRGKTIGIVGFGHTGSHFAEVLAGFGVRVLAFDKYKKAGYAADYAHVEETRPERLRLESDIISFHLPLTDETKHLADATYINQCKHGVLFINTSRGQVLETSALVAALENGQVGGVCMDVFENEKPKTYTKAEKLLFNRLFRFKNTVFTPHVAGWTHESKKKMAKSLLDKISKNHAF